MDTFEKTSAIILFILAVGLFVLSSNLLQASKITQDPTKAIRLEGASEMTKIFGIASTIIFLFLILSPLFEKFQK